MRDVVSTLKVRLTTAYELTQGQNSSCSLLIVGNIGALHFNKVWQECKSTVNALVLHEHVPVPVSSLFSTPHVLLVAV
jgi:hypothetical protein